LWHGKGKGKSLKMITNYN